MILEDWNAGLISFSEARHNIRRGGLASQDDNTALAEIKQNPPMDAALQLQALQQAASSTTLSR